MSFVPNGNKLILHHSIHRALDSCDVDCVSMAFIVHSLGRDERTVRLLSYDAMIGMSFAVLDIRLIINRDEHSFVLREAHPGCRRCSTCFPLLCITGHDWMCSSVEGASNRMAFWTHKFGCKFIADLNFKYQLLHTREIAQVIELRRNSFD